jgi:GrpB-like predicted nucleotidyltransferase (UPF0157 family)
MIIGPVTITVVPYDHQWPAQFASIRDELGRALADIPVLAIEHVGSTSVPELAAKPIIDIDVVVERDQVPKAIGAVTAGGYRHLGDLGIADRHALGPPDDGIRRNVYVVVAGSLALRNHLAVRDALRRDEALRAEYGQLKRDLAARGGIDIDTYVAGKTELIGRILAEAGFTDEEIAAIAAANAPR